jgi:hypothetical protein
MHTLQINHRDNLKRIINDLKQQMIEILSNLAYAAP